MNNLWQVERLVELKQQELQRELEQARLLREAGIQRKNRLAQAVAALRSLVRRRRNVSQKQAAVEPQASPSVSD
jgi:G:T/U-mismatch repair DNA glycosylase